VTVDADVVNGFKTANRRAVAGTAGAVGREALRNVGQGVLLDAVTAYSNVPPINRWWKRNALMSHSCGKSSASPKGA